MPTITYTETHILSPEEFEELASKVKKDIIKALTITSPSDDYNISVRRVSKKRNDYKVLIKDLNFDPRVLNVPAAAEAIVPAPIAAAFPEATPERLSFTRIPLSAFNVRVPAPERQRCACAS